MSRTIVMKREEAPEDKTLSAELPPIKDWQVHFVGPAAQTPPVPWDVGRRRVESSGLIFLQGVAERLQREQAEWGANGAAKAEPFQALPTTGVLTPTAHTGHHGILWAAGIATLLVLGVGAAVGLRVWQDGYAVTDAGGLILGVAPQSPKAAPAGEPEGVASALPVRQDRAAEDSATPARKASPSVTPAAAPTKPASVTAPAVVESPKARRTRTKRDAYRAERRAERKAEKVAEAKRQQELAQLPSAYDALRAAAPAPAPTPAPRPAVKTPAPREATAPAIPVAAAGGDTYQMLRTATASLAPRPQAKVAAAELPRKLSSKVLYSRALRVQTKARGCLRTFGFSHEVVSLRLEIDGASGKVARAAVGGRFAAMPVGQCLVRAAQGLRFPRFTDGHQTVVVPVTGK